MTKVGTLSHETCDLMSEMSQDDQLNHDRIVYASGIPRTDTPDSKAFPVKLLNSLGDMNRDIGFGSYANPQSSVRHLAPLLGMTLTGTMRPLKTGEAQNHKSGRRGNLEHGLRPLSMPRCGAARKETHSSLLERGQSPVSRSVLVQRAPS